MPGSWPPSPSDAIIDTMSCVPKDDDDMPALEHAGSQPLQIVTPEVDSVHADSDGHGQPSPPATAAPSDSATAQAYFLNMTQAPGHAVASPTSSPDLDQNSQSNTTHPFPPPLGSTESSNQGAPLPPALHHHTPLSFFALLQTAIAAAHLPAPSGSADMPVLPPTSHGGPPAVANKSPSHSPDGGGNDATAVPSATLLLPHIQASVPSSSILTTETAISSGDGAPQDGTTNAPTAAYSADFAADFNFGPHPAASINPAMDGFLAGVLYSNIPAPLLATDTAAGFAAYMADDGPPDVEPAPITPMFGVWEPFGASGLMVNLADFEACNRPLRRPWDVATFVDSLEEVDISTIAPEDMRCPHCWLPFGTTVEDEPDFAMTIDPDDLPELAECRDMFREMAFDATRADNDPVRTPCGHIFGRACLIESLEKVNTKCPMCRTELRPRLGSSP